MKTNFKIDGMINNTMPSGYAMTENGLYKLVYNKATKQEEKVRISQPISIAKISFDINKSAEFVELRFFKSVSKDSGRLISVSIRTSDLEEQKGLKPLADAGFRSVQLSEVKYYIKQALMTIMDERMEGIETDCTNETGAGKYGFLGVGGDIGHIDYNNFVGIDSDIIFANAKMNEYDNNIFVKRGTLDGWKIYADKLATGVGARIVKMTIGASVIGVINSLPGFLTMDPPVIALTGKSGAGKGFDANLKLSVWGEIGKTNTFRMSETSTAAGMRIVKDRANILPVILDDIAPILDKQNGIAELKAMIYGHTNDSNRVVSTADCKLNESVYTWLCPFILYGEQNKLDLIKDGGANRFIQFDFGNEKDELISDYSKAELNAWQYENVGIVGPLFVKAIQEDIRKGRDFKKEFDEIQNEILDKYFMNNKIADNYALLCYSYRLMKEYNLLPANWEDYSVDEFTQTFDISRTKTTDELIYESFIDMINNHALYYPDRKEIYTQSKYDEAEKNGTKISGRRTIENVEGRTATVLIILKENFDMVIQKVCKNLSLTQTKINPKTWANEGWLLKTTAGRNTWQMTNITREFDAKDPIKSIKENCYKIVIEYADEDVVIDDLKLEAQTKAYNTQLEEVQKALNNISTDDIIHATHEYIESKAENAKLKNAINCLLKEDIDIIFFSMLEEKEQKFKEIRQAVKNYDYDLDDEGNYIKGEKEMNEIKKLLETIN